MLIVFGVGILTGLTTVLFGFGGGFVTVPVLLATDAALGGAAPRVAVATSAVVMVVNAGIATAATRRDLLRALLSGGPALPLLLALGGTVGALAARWAPADLTRWAFVAYLAGTIVDLLLRPGFLRPAEPVPERARIPAVAGVPIGAVAAFLGVGGSVLTVPLLRRAGHPMRTATALANPLTLAIAVPATVVFLAAAGRPAGTGGVALLGSVDLGAAGALLAGAVPVIVALRRRPPRLPDRRYAQGYLALLIVVTAVMAVLAVRGG